MGLQLCEFIEVSVMDKSRKRRILEKLDEEGFLTVSAAADYLGCTQATIRREFSQLEQSGHLKRVHGGAIRMGSNFVHKSVKEMLYQHLYEKLEIAKLAYDLIQDGDCIVVDDATTCMYLGNMILDGPRKQLKVITNSVLLAGRIMEAPQIELEVIGGTVAGNLAATEGETACAQLEMHRADKAFIGVNGIDFEKGITLTGYPQQKVKQKMMEISRESYILADSSKFGKSYLSFLCMPQDVTAILTDQGLPEDQAQKALQLGIPVQKRKKPSGNV